jgi:hypothetical protein
MRNLNVGKLKKLIEGLADDVLVVGPAPDHEYRQVDGEATTALIDEESRCMTEDHGEDVTPEADYGKRITVLVIS